MYSVPGSGQAPDAAMLASMGGEAGAGQVDSGGLPAVGAGQSGHWSNPYVFFQLEARIPLPRGTTVRSAVLSQPSV